MTDTTRLRILKGAGPIFAEKGFDGTTVREICAAAEVNLASVNYHFGGKETLYQQAVQLAHREKLLRVPPPEWSVDVTPEDKLHSFVRTILTRMVGEANVGWETRLLMREMLQPTHACRPLVEEYIRPQFEQLLRILAELVPEVRDASVRHRIAFSIVGQCLHYRVASEFVSLLIGEEFESRAYSVDALAELITRFSLSGIRGFQELPASCSNRDESRAAESNLP